MADKDLLSLGHESLKRIIRAKVDAYIARNYNPGKIPYVVYSVGKRNETIVRYEIKKIYYDYQYKQHHTMTKKNMILAKMANKNLHKLRFYINVKKFDPAKNPEKVNMSLYWYLERIRLGKLVVSYEEAEKKLAELKYTREISQGDNFRCDYCKKIEPVETINQVTIHFKSFGENRNFCCVQCAVDFQAEIYEEKTIKVLHKR